MTTDPDTTRIVRSWLEEGVTSLPDPVLDAVLDRLPATPQRRANWLARRFPEMNTTSRLILAAAVVLAVGLLGIRYLLPANVGGPGLDDPTPSPSPIAGLDDPTPSPSPIAEPIQLPGMGTDLAAGLYTLGPEFPVDLTIELQNYGRPDLSASDWTSCGEGGVEQSICRFVDGEEGRAVDVAIGFLYVTNVVADPCDEASLLDPALGPSVDDLVAAISNLPGFETPVGPAGDASLGGFDGRGLTITAVYAPEEGDCGATWATPARVNYVGPGETNNVYVLDVDGVRIVVSVAYNEGTISDDGLNRVEDVLETIQINPH